ncbi:hypothetical protein SDC9_201628 [bioreactor metagenome]|uniref:Uncharacterized protein n=1 Tax=bioreactor metagenome TaxID=1076179 RepID=A0A645IU75_9ZZZZ
MLCGPDTHGLIVYLADTGTMRGFIVGCGVEVKNIDGLVVRLCYFFRQTQPVLSEAVVDRGI